MNLKEALNKAGDINSAEIASRAQEIESKINVDLLAMAAIDRVTVRSLILAAMAMGFEAGRIYETGTRTYGDIDPASRTAEAVYLAPIAP